ncbi:DNA-binding protein [Halorubellus sp. JP-L1]|uniref:helix-turn-helix domain-containing protein n=1 Tax=Halorubellus sp. JP-L1 TaxID=2715753 RepID=UPI00140942E9|nr:helix-turn-helix domain-containing protein [Halorubellus sp. JP-L1]NHN42362.1 DNA-binding protein [Halorubellus sp. JP-L1]
MTDGIRAEIRVDGPTGCPVTHVVDRTGIAATDVRRAVSTDGRCVTEEFLLADPLGIDLAETGLEDQETGASEEIGASEESDVEFQRVFDYGDHVTYRFERDRDVACPCETVEAHGSPVTDVDVRDDGVHVAFHVADMAALQALVADLRDAFPSLDVKRLLRSEGEPGTHTLVFVDRGRLTARQLEVLETAHDMGYFSHPKGANAGEVAEALSITRATFSEHLAAAQSKLLDAILD